MDEDFKRWQAIVHEELKVNRPDIPFEGLSLDAMRNAFRAGISPANFSALPEQEILPLRSGPFDDLGLTDGPVEFTNNPSTCIWSAVFFLGGVLVMVVSAVLLSLGALGKPTAGSWATIAIIATLCGFGGCAYLLMLRTKWVLYNDRLEYYGMFGSMKSIRKQDVKSFSRGLNMSSYYLTDGKNTIFIGRPIDDWQSLRDTLKGWTATNRAVIQQSVEHE